MEPRLGILAAQGRPFDDLVTDWLYIESLGFDHAWLIDHLRPEFAPAAPIMDSWTCLAGLAARTATIRLGVAVTNAAIRHPAVLARSATTIDQISAGRLEIAVGAGFYNSELKMLGLPLVDGRGRGERLREAVEVLDVSLRGETATMHGKHWTVDGFPPGPRPIQQPRPPLWVAASRRYSLETAARHADVLVTMGDGGDQPPATLDKLHSRFATFDELARAAGRDPRSIRRAYLVGWSAERPYESETAFTDFVGQFAEAGVTDFILEFGQLGRRQGLERIASWRRSTVSS